MLHSIAENCLEAYALVFSIFGDVLIIVTPIVLFIFLVCIIMSIFEN